MNADIISPIRRASPSQWAGVTLAAAVVALGVISVASAEGAGANGAHAGTIKKCANPNSNNGCIGAINTSTGNAVYGYNDNNGYGVLGLTLSSNYAGTEGANFAAGPGVVGTSNSRLRGRGLLGFQPRRSRPERPPQPSRPLPLGTRTSRRGRSC